VSAYLEVMIEGNCRAYLKADSLMGIITSPGASGDTVATPDEPLSLILSGNTLPGVYGISPNRLMVHAAGAKMLLREEGKLAVVAYLDSHQDFENRIAHHLEKGDG
jgi:hypothetical protein